MNSYSVLAAVGTAAPLINPPHGIGTDLIWLLGGALLAAFAAITAWYIGGCAPSIAAPFLVPVAVVFVGHMRVPTHVAIAYCTFAAVLNALLWVWRAQDNGAGGSVAADASARRGLLTLARWPVSALRLRYGTLANADGTVIGHARNGRGVRVSHAGDSPSHTVLIGETGSGKSRTAAVLAQATIAQHRTGAVIIDLKGDPELTRALWQAAEDAGKEFRQWNGSIPVSFDAYSDGEPSEIVDRLLAGHVFSEAHYELMARRYLQHLVAAFRASGAPLTLGAIVMHIDQARAYILLRTMPEGATAAAFEQYLDGLTDDHWRGLTGVRDRLAVLAESTFGRHLDPTSPAPVINLLDSVLSGEVVLFQISADRFPYVADAVVTAILSNLLWIVSLGELEINLPPFLIMIDEAGAAQPHLLPRLFQRGRGAGASVVVATQHPADLHGADAKLGVPAGTLFRQIVANAGTMIIHRQAEPEAASYFAELCGTVEGWKPPTRRRLG